MSRFTTTLGSIALASAFALPAFAAPQGTTTGPDGVVLMPGPQGEKGEMREPAPATKSRGEVKSETQELQNLQGEAAARRNSETGYGPRIEQSPSVRSRDDVIQDLERARRDGTLDSEHEG